MTGGLGFHFFCGGTRIDEILWHAAIDKQNLLLRETLAIVGRAQLVRMIDVVPKRVVIAENFFAHAVIEARAFVEKCSGGKIVEKKSDEIEDGRRFKDRGVVAGRQLS